MTGLPAHCERIAKMEGVERLLSLHGFWKSLPVIPQDMIDLLLSQSVEALTIGSAINRPLKVAHGHCANDRWFEPVTDGPPCIAVPIDDGAGIIDIGFWDPATGQMATYWHYGFALGEEHINDPATYAFDGHLTIFESPLEWLRNKREGIYVLDWSRAFDRLRHCSRIAIDARLLPTYRAAMKPPRMPELCVVTDDKEAA